LQHLAQRRSALRIRGLVFLQQIRSESSSASATLDGRFTETPPAPASGLLSHNGSWSATNRRSNFKVLPAKEADFRFCCSGVPRSSKSFRNLTASRRICASKCRHSYLYSLLAGMQIVQRVGHKVGGQVRFLLQSLLRKTPGPANPSNDYDNDFVFGARCSQKFAPRTLRQRGSFRDAIAAKSGINRRTSIHNYGASKKDDLAVRIRTGAGVKMGRFHA